MESSLKALDDWIIPRKKEIHEKNIKGPRNTPAVLQNYMNELEQLNNNICRALREPDVNVRDSTLKALGWPDDLIECTKEINARTDVKDRLEKWCKTYTQNAELLTRQIRDGNT